MCRQVLAIEAMTTEDCTFSAGVIRGGRWVNCVPTTCELEVLSMAKRQADLEAGVARMLALRSSTPDVVLEVRRGVTRPVWEPDAGVMELYDRARSLARAIGFDLSHQSSGGGSDGNFTGAMGVPTLDGLGVGGAGAHTPEEHLVVGTLVPRARLLAGLLATLG
jgi:glutamate carboxypeptidase